MDAYNCWAGRASARGHIRGPRRFASASLTDYRRLVITHSPGNSDWVASIWLI